jgi:hypothetical protein
MRRIFMAALLLMTVVQAPAQSAPVIGAKWRALLGEWSGEGGGAPGSGGGTCSFKFDLQEHVLVRRNHSEYPASGNRPATAHDDLMVIYPGSGEDESRAIYFDNEGHVIKYAATWSATGDTLTFVSEPATGTPQFRLIYKKQDAQTWTLSFEIAPPGQSGTFKPYVSGRLRRSGA